MTKNDHTNYISSAMQERLDSPAYHLAVFRDPATIQKEELMDEFLSHVESEFEMSQEEMSDLQALVNDFLGYDIKRAEQGELELLDRWNKSVTGE